MRFAHFFVDRPIFASVTSIVILIIGYVSYISLPVSQYPEIVPPTVVVRASYPGANAETVAATIATPIEQEINGVDNMLYMSSLSTNDGNMQLTVTFALGTNLDIANVLVQNRLSVAQPRLPGDVRNLGVTVRKSSPDLMMVVHVLSPDGTFDQNYLANYIYLRLRDPLLRLNGVGDITVFGGSEYALRLWLDPNKLASYQLSTTDVINALQEQNVQVASGALGAPPAPASQAFQLTVQTQGGSRTRASSARSSSRRPTGAWSGSPTSPGSSSARRTTRRSRSSTASRRSASACSSGPAPTRSRRPSRSRR